MAVEGLDTNKDGKYSREELAELAKVNVTSLKDFGYFTLPTLAGQAVKVADPSDLLARVQRRHPGPAFHAAVCQPGAAGSQGVRLSVYDPSFFIAFDLAKTDQPVRLAKGRPRVAH